MREATIEALILAGGAGTRVGGGDKGCISWQGQPLIASVVARIRPQVDALYISCNRNQEVYAALADGIVTDRRAGFQGPLAGLEAASGLLQADFISLAACDTPELPTDLVMRLMAPLLEQPQLQVALAYDGERAQNLCAVLRRHSLTTLTDYLAVGGRSVHGWYAGLRCVQVDFSATAAAFRNYNQLQDLRC